MRPMSANACKLFGKIAIELGYLDAAMLQEGLQVQAALATQGRPLAMGSVLRNLGYLTVTEVDEVLARQKSDAGASDLYLREAALFGELAVENGFASRKHVDEALRLQAAQPESFKMGMALVKRRVITNEQRLTLVKAMERAVRDAKESSAKKKPEAQPAAALPAKKTGRRARPFSGLFLFDPDAPDDE